MRVTRIQIAKWRNFENVSIEVPADATLVCLVGENGTGKSNVLELLSGVAERVGLTHGTDSPRGSPFGDDHDFVVVLELPKDREKFLGADWQKMPAFQAGWNGHLEIEFKKGVPAVHRFGNCGGNNSEAFYDQLRETLRRLGKINYLLLDADRSYPPVEVTEHQLGEVIGRDWDGDEWMYRRTHFRSSRLYQEWVQYLVGKESQAADTWMEKSRSAKRANQPLQDFTEPFQDYRSSLETVLPHLTFQGADRKNRTAIFNSAGNALRFHQLSGGEREIAFMVGQVSRFGLRRGLFLIDEPELHLNPELVRSWVTWLRNTMVDGQTWLATHSLEAAEAAGAENVFVFERSAVNNPARLVKSIRPLVTLPALQTLSAAIGSPAFSISRHKFIWIEGEPAGGEKTRYFALFGDDKALRFLEAGNCHEVERKFAAVQGVAVASGQPIRVGGIVDSDFRSHAEIARLAAAGLIVLPCHEVENFFLHPDTLKVVAAKIGAKVDPTKAIVDAHDEVAGPWIFQRACASNDFSQVDLKAARAAIAPRNWASLVADGDKKVAHDTVAHLNCAAALKIQFSAAIVASFGKYAAERATPDFWIRCMGKQVLQRLPKAIGFASQTGLENALQAAWTENPKLRPAEHAKVAVALGAL
jgi:predicted ATPase